MATTTMGTNPEKKTNTGMYWMIGLAVIVLLAFAWSMRPNTYNAADRRGQTTTAPVENTMNSNRTMTDGTTVNGTINQNTTNPDGTAPVPNQQTGPNGQSNTAPNR